MKRLNIFVRSGLQQTLFLHYLYTNGYSYKDRKDLYWKFTNGSGAIVVNVIDKIILGGNTGWFATQSHMNVKEFVDKAWEFESMRIGVL